MRVALFQVAPDKGDRAATLAQIGQLVREAQTTGAELCLFPETVLSGYFLEGGVREAARTVDQIAAQILAAALAADVAPTPIDVVLGAYCWGGPAESEVRNSALWFRLAAGGVSLVARHDKIFLPTYGLFDEGRDVAPGETVTVVTTPAGRRVALLVCEDAWHSLTGTVAALEGADTVLVLAASPARGFTPQGTAQLGAFAAQAPAGGIRANRAPSVEGADSAAAWYRLASNLAAEHGCWVVTSHLVGVEAGRLLSGASCVVDPSGTMRLRLDPWGADWAPVELDLEAVRRARQAMPLGRDLRARAYPLLAQLQRAATAPVAVAAKGRAFGASAPWAASRLQPPADPIALDAGRLRAALVHGLRTELARRGFSRVILGLSGGLDSAVVAALAVETLGPAAVEVVAMPDAGSSPASLADAQTVAAHLGLTLRVLPLGDVAATLAPVLAPDARRRGNLLARLRTMVLFDQGLATHALPLGTGNKSERLLGYFTWHGDDAPPLNPLGDLYKTQVVALAHELGLPASVITKAPSADLEPGQSDEGDLGAPYAELDPALAGLLRSPEGGSGVGDRPREAGELVVAQEAACRRLAQTHWKRHGATSLMVSDHAIGEGFRRPRDA